MSANIMKMTATSLRDNDSEIQQQINYKCRHTYSNGKRIRWRSQTAKPRFTLHHSVLFISLQQQINDNDDHLNDNLLKLWRQKEWMGMNCPRKSLHRTGSQQQRKVFLQVKYNLTTVFITRELNYVKLFSIMFAANNIAEFYPLHQKCIAKTCKLRTDWKGNFFPETQCYSTEQRVSITTARVH